MKLTSSQLRKLIREELEALAVNEITDDQLNKPFMKTLGITKKDGKYMQDGEEKTADYIQKLYDRREKASEKRSGKGRS